ncbi:alkaline phosphatase [Amyelois transitella]|uniref:alkaline phosphatase n=1 Tax=Amyelois transitella TaxID=680683 RepID=UPI00067DF050|nr:alkaline phosphatase [Amyelois transitella]
MWARVLFLCIIFYTARCSLRTDQEYWTSLAENELQEALKVKLNIGVAKNVIIFIGDGMGPNTVTTTRIYKGGESHRLEFEKFPHVGLLKTYSANAMVPDSACTATAMFCGVKVNKDTVGVDASVQRKDCERSLQPEARLNCLAGIALQAGKSAGFVTTMRVTHATPSPLYAHSADRLWECEDHMPVSAKQCKDHARQLFEEWPGRDLNVIMGGGKQSLVSNIVANPDPWTCTTKDGRDMIETFRKDKESRGLNYSVVSNTGELKNFNKESDYLLGIFANSHMDYEYQKDKSPEGMPSISEMVEAAITVLKRNENGYFLMVEGGNIDMAHHRGRAKLAISEAAAMEEAVKVAATMTDEEDTLLIVTSDHTHTLNINGYPARGSNIFGVAETSPYDGVNYTTLAYTTGGPDSFQYFAQTEDDNRTRVMRRDPGLEDTDSMEYKQIAAITLAENSHGGGDVIVYARGPHAHLFHNVHEQNYVFHVIQYAAKIGAYDSSKPSAASDIFLNNVLTTIATATLLLLS